MAKKLEALKSDLFTFRTQLAQVKELISSVERQMNIGMAKIEARLVNVEARLDAAEKQPEASKSEQPTVPTLVSLLEKLERKRVAAKKTKTKR